MAFAVFRASICAFRVHSQSPELGGPTMTSPSPRIICAVLVLVLAGTTAALAADYDIHLQSRRFTPAEEVMRLDEPGHVVIQFRDIPTQSEREELARNGVRLLDYIPNYAWTASVDPGALGALDRASVRAVFTLAPDDKVSQTAFGQTNVRVFVYDDVSDPVPLLSQYGAVTPDEGNIYVVDLDAELLDVASEDVVKYIMGPRPEKALENDDLRDAINADEVQTAPYSLSGNGLYAGIWDGGSVATNHDDFAGRLTIADGSGTASHATKCCGIMAGDGSRSQAEGGSPYQWRGVATEVDIASYDWPNDCDDMDAEAADAISNYDIIVSSNSWGWGLCPNYCYYYGTYDDWSQNYDEIVRGSQGKKLTVVFSAGNDGDCGSCSGDLPDFPYGTIPGPGSTSKNAIVVGSTNADNDALSGYSSHGPTLDGRTKPDVTAPGCKSYAGITTTYLYNDYSGSSCGTSFSAPAVSGCVVLTQEDFIDKFGGEAWPSTVKALFVQGADDLGNTGPDYQFGFGRVNIQNTIDIIRDDGGTGDLIQEDTLSPTETWEYQVDVSGESELKVTLAWDDYQGDYEGSGRMLVNDLDLEIISPSRATYHPFLLDPDNPSNTAATGVDDLNNIEQVIVSSPGSGTWTIRVTASVMPQPDQDFSVVTNVAPGAGDPPPAAPTGLGASSGSGQGEIDVDWDDNTEPDLDHYIVERADNPSFAGSTTWTTSSSDYADSGLAPGDTYYYRVYAVDTGSNQSPASGSDSAVATDLPPATPTGLNAVPGAGEGEIDVDWDDNTEGDLDHYVLERADNVSFTGSTTFTVSVSSYSDSGLAPGDTYYYRVYAVDTGSNQSAASGSDSAVATDLPPAAPTGLAATAGSGDGEIDLDWDDNTEGDLDHYVVERADNAGFSGSTTFNVGVSDYADSGLTPGETYHYRVYAVDAGSNQSDPSSSTASAAGDAAPAAPTGLVAMTGGIDGEVDLDWDDNTEADLDHYVVERADNPAFSGSVTFNVGASEYADSGLVPGQTYHYRVYAVDTGANQSDPSSAASASAADLPPAAPTGLVATAGDADGEIDLDWDDNTDADFDHYVLERADNVGFSGSTTIDVGASEYFDTGLIRGQLYYYRVYAVDAGSNQSAPSVSDNAYAADYPPAIPTGVTASSGTQHGEIDVDWNDNTEPDLDDYLLERADNASFTGSTFFSVGASEFADAGLTPGQTYYYRVYAVDNGSNQSLASAYDSAAAADPAPAAPTGLVAVSGTDEGDIDLDWDDNVEADLDHYVLERADNPSFTGSTTFNVGVSEFADAGLTPSQTYHYRVYAVDTGSNQSAPSDPDSAAAFDVAPAAPTGVTSSPGPGDAEITVSWDANGEADLDHYRVERDTTDLFGAGSVSFETADISYLDSAVLLGNTYYYRIFAVDEGENESAPSDTVSEYLENTGVPEDVEGGLRFIRPNPFSAQTTVAYSVPATGAQVSIRIYDITGRLIQTLFEGQRSGGVYEAAWRGRDRTGRTVASGVYFCRSTIGGTTELRKIAYLR
ncbi:MAG: S8 family serine peptidase [Candidatus Eisenbacteria bacterium]|nr:S8 family serine peptidase [Candidatus Eisenbacteria bacterium]